LGETKENLGKGTSYRMRRFRRKPGGVVGGIGRNIGFSTTKLGRGKISCPRNEKIRTTDFGKETLLSALQQSRELKREVEPEKSRDQKPQKGWPKKEEENTQRRGIGWTK